MPAVMSAGFRTLTSPTAIELMSFGLVTGPVPGPSFPPQAAARISPTGANLFITRQLLGRVRGIRLIPAAVAKGQFRRPTNLRPMLHVKAPHPVLCRDLAVSVYNCLLSVP